MDIFRRRELLSIISKYAKEHGEADTADSSNVVLRFDACSVSIRRKSGLVSAEIRPSIFPARYDIEDDDDGSAYHRLVYRGNRNGLREVSLERFVLTHEMITEDEKKRLEKVDPAYVIPHMLFKESPRKRRITSRDNAFFDFMIAYCAGKCQAPKIAEDYDNVT